MFVARSDARILWSKGRANFHNPTVAEDFSLTLRSK